MLDSQLIIGIIAALVIIIGFVYLAKVIFGLQKQISELVLRNDEKKEHTVNNIESNIIDNENMIVVENHDLNECKEIENNIVIQELSEQVVEKGDNQENIRIGKMVESYLSASVESDIDVSDYHEANIMVLNKSDGKQTSPVDPNKVSLKSTERFFDLDIIIEKTPIGKAMENNLVERKR